VESRQENRRQKKTEQVRNGPDKFFEEPESLDSLCCRTVGRGSDRYVVEVP